MFCDSIVIFDHLYSIVKVVSNVFLPDNCDNNPELIKNQYNEALLKIQSIVKILMDPKEEVVLPNQPPIISDKAVSNIGKEGYEGFVISLKKYIANGDIIQVVPSQRVSKRTNLHPFNAYRMLRTVNPAPYMFYIGMEKVH